jgi:outer membrane biosynthesis protein TonB
VGTLAALICLVLAQDHGPWTPARYLAGGIPPLPRSSAGGEVVLELTVDEYGAVTSIVPIRTTPPFAERLAAEARGWVFSPAMAEQPDPKRPNARTRVAVATKVLVIGKFRPPVRVGGTIGELPKDVGNASPEAAFPKAMVMPRYPPMARSGGQVLAEARVNPDGLLGELKLIVANPPFESAALDALQQFTFRPASRSGAPVASFVYVLFGFPTPIDSPRKEPR